MYENFSVAGQASQESENQRKRLQRRCFTCRSRGERGDCRDPFQLPEESEGAARRESVNRAVSQVGRKYFKSRKYFLYRENISDPMQHWLVQQGMTKRNISNIFMVQCYTFLIMTCRNILQNIKIFLVLSLVVCSVWSLSKCSQVLSIKHVRIS